MKKVIAAILGAAFLISGCNTVEGFGRDVEKVGDKIEHKAQDARK